MGDRALIAYEQADGTVESYYSHYGASQLMLRAPLRKGVQAGDDHEFTASDGHTRTFKNKVDTEPYTEPVADIREFVHDVVDYVRHNAVYIVPAGNPEKTVAYRPISYRFDARSDAYDRHDGVLLSPRWYEGQPQDTRILGQTEGIKFMINDLLDNDEITNTEAKRALDAQLVSMVERRSRQTWATIGMDSDANLNIAFCSPRAQAERTAPTYQKKAKS